VSQTIGLRRPPRFERGGVSDSARPLKEQAIDDLSDLHLSAPILKALQDEGYRAHAHQAKAILVLQGDLLGIAQTGTGKTAAFAR
jgi:superfamily II DNA/RNA helicase